MSTLPYVTSPGNINKALKAILAAAVPTKVSQDFVKTILKIPGGSGDQMTTYLKKIGFATADGSPSEIYRKFRNPSSSGQAISTAIRRAYAPLYIRNEFMHELNSTELVGLIVEETGLPHDSNPVKLATSCIEHLKEFATFNDSDSIVGHVASPNESLSSMPTSPSRSESLSGNVALNLGYTINLNLPATSDPAVFDAIFKSLKENLLREDDG